MIQRIQTVYLLLTTILSVIFLNGHLIKFTGGQKNVLDISSDGVRIVDNIDGSTTLWILLLLTSLVLLILLFSFIAVFFYRKRKIQMKLAGGLIILVCLLILGSAFYYFFVTRQYAGEIRLGMNMLILPVMLLASYLAYRGIKKDEELVKSYDRLR
jgi:glucan phosphoethanolaminetransferase (alkaline phosphatase superfamily)